MNATGVHPGAAVALDIISSFSFLEGASQPEELVRRAAAMGLRAIAVADRATLAGAVRTFVAARAAGIHPIVAARLEVTAGDACIDIILPCIDHRGYANLCGLITRRHAHGPDGAAGGLHWHDLDGHLDGLHAIVVPRRGVQPATAAFHDALADLARRAPGRVSLALSHTAEGDDDLRWWQACALADHVGVPVVAAHPAHMHVPVRQPVHDVLCCIRHGTTLERAGSLLAPNAERFLGSAIGAILGEEIKFTPASPKPVSQIPPFPRTLLPPPPFPSVSLCSSKMQRSPQMDLSAPQSLMGEWGRSLNHCWKP